MAADPRALTGATGFGGRSTRRTARVSAFEKRERSQAKRTFRLLYFQQHLGVVQVEIQAGEVLCFPGVWAVPKDRFCPVALIE